MQKLIRSACEHLKSIWKTMIEELKNPKDPFGGASTGYYPPYYM